jgi:hypothetical protein
MKQKSREDVSSFVKPTGTSNPNGGLLSARKFGATSKVDLKNPIRNVF